MLEPVYELLATELQQANALILSELQTDVPFINELSNHIVQSGGKRLRPIVLLLSAKSCAYEGENHIPLAVAMEFFHTATLLHDDVVDESALRRGKLTANELFGDKASILVGDFLFTRSFQLITKAEKMSIIQLLADTSNKITRGEVLQLLNCKQGGISERDYFDVIESKTAVLFAAAAQSAALLSECSTSIADSLRNYGMAIGNAFQIVDDILDYSASAAEMGKNVGDDLAEGKTTLPMIYALESADTTQKALLTEALAQHDKTHLNDIITIMQETQALDRCFAVAKHEIDHAKTCLQALPPSPYRDALALIADFAVTRSY